MQDTAIDRQPHQLAPVIHLALAAAVAAALTAILVIASSASHTAVRTLSAQFQPTRHVTLPPVEIVGRRAVAIEQGDAPQGRSAAAADTTPACVQPT
jgi:hypothetical protein